jgi:hypothetical protein
MQIVGKPDHPESADSLRAAVHTTNPGVTFVNGAIVLCVES